MIEMASENNIVIDKNKISEKIKVEDSLQKFDAIEVDNLKTLEGLKTSENIVEAVVKNFDKDFNTIEEIEWKTILTQITEKLDTYQTANNEFNTYIEGATKLYQATPWKNPEELQILTTLKTLTDQIQAKIDQKIQETLNTIAKDAQKQREAGVKNFTKLTDADIKAYQDIIAANKAIIDIYKENTNEGVIKEYTEAQNQIDNIQKIIDLKWNITTLDKDRLQALKIFVSTQKFEKADQQTIIANIDKAIPAAPESQNTIAERQLDNQQLVTNTLNLSNETVNNIENFFEKPGNEAWYNATFDYISEIISNQNLEVVTNTDLTKKNDITAFKNIIMLYGQSKGLKSEEMTNIQLFTAKIDDPTYPVGTRVIRFDRKINDKTIQQDILFWTQDQMQLKKADKFDDDMKNIDLALDNPLVQFNNKGNYRAFEKYITQNPDKLEKNFDRIVNAIIAYQKPTEGADAQEDISDLKDGYATVLTNYISRPQTSDALMSGYMTFLLKGNADILWGSAEARLNNLKTLQTNTLFNEKFKALSPEEQKNILKFIAEDINKYEKKSLLEVIMKMMMMFWFKKWKIKSLFPKELSDKIDKEFNKIFELKEEKKTAITEVVKWSKLSSKKGLYIQREQDEKGNDIIKWYNAPKAENLKAAFGNKTENMIDIIMGDPKYYTKLDPGIIQLGINKYNKDPINRTTLQKSNFINSNNEVDVNLVQNRKKDFIDVLTGLMKSGDTWSTIADANKSIASLLVNKDKETYSDYFNADELDDRFNHVIDSEESIGKFAAMYLFAGSRDLGYLETVNHFEWTDIVPAAPTKYTTNEEITLLATTVKIAQWITVTEKGRKRWEEIWLKEDKNTYILVTDGTNTWYVLESMLTKEKTDEDKYQENKDKFNAEYNKITKDKPNEYNWFDFSKFVYNVKPDQKQTDYQNNILMPIQNIMTNTNQYNLFIKEDFSKAEWIQQNLTHLKNMLAFMDGTNSTALYTEAMEKLWVEWNTYTIEKKWDNLVITSKKWETMNWTITLSNTANTLSAKREETKITAQPEVPVITKWQEYTSDVLKLTQSDKENITRLKAEDETAVVTDGKINGKWSVTYKNPAETKTWIFENWVLKT